MLEEYRKEFKSHANGSLSMPIAGLIVWAVVGALSTGLNAQHSVYALMFMTGAIFPVALLVAKFRNENLIAAQNPLSKLLGLCILMVNLLWGLHVPLALSAPEFVPLSLGIGLGLHWVVFSWIIDHPVGIIHSVVRTVLVPGPVNTN